MEALGLNLGYLIVQIVNFLVLLIILRAWVYRPLLNMLENRRKKIEQGLEDARVAEEARENAEEEARKILSDAQAEANGIVSDARVRAEEVAREVKAEAESDAAKIRENATAEAKQARDQTLANMRGQIATLAVAASQKLIGESLDEQRQHALINEFFSGVREGKVTVLKETRLSGASAEVTSAVPLTDEEQAAVKEDVLAQIGEQATVTFRVDPTILGGIIIQVGDKVLDNSVAGQLSDLRQSLS